MVHRYSHTAPHWVNLLGQNITPESINKHITDINKYFWNNDLLSAWPKEFPGSVKPQLPGVTRWKSQLACIEAFLKYQIHGWNNREAAWSNWERHCNKNSEHEPLFSSSWRSHPTASCCWCYQCSSEWLCWPCWCMPPLAQTSWSPRPCTYKSSFRIIIIIITVCYLTYIDL